jgi:tetratricopeptide (TPR) repeat protein
MVALLVCAVICLRVAAQTTDTATAIIKQGIALHNQGKYSEAMDKFNIVLKTDPENAYANYEIAFSLYAAKKPKDGIPYLAKAVKTDNANISTAAYALLGSIYDDANEFKKSIESYGEAIKINANYPQIYYNLGLTFFRAQQYSGAEACAVEAITRNPKHASSQRMYGLVTFHQDKRVNALLGLCSFILLEPTGTRAAEAYGNIQHILQGGVLVTKGDTNNVIPTDQLKENNTLNIGIQLATSSAKAKNLAGIDALEYDMKSIFTFAGELSAKKAENEKTFVDKFFVSYFYKLAQSNNMTTFAHTVAATSDPKEAAWLKAHPEQLGALNEWVKITPREPN